MPPAHICLRCGFDLSRLRAVVDAHYGLMLVRCPSCDRACARRFGEVRARRRLRRQRIHSGMTLSLQLFVAFWFVLGLGALSTVIESEYAEFIQIVRSNGFLAIFGGPNIHWIDSSAVSIFYFSFSPVCFGLWVHATLGHLRPWPRWLLASAMILAGAAFVLLTSEMFESIERARWAIRHGMAGAHLARCSVGAGIILALALCGAPIGTVVSRMWVTGRRQKFRRRLARTRRRRRRHA